MTVDAHAHASSLRGFLRALGSDVPCYDAAYELRIHGFQG